MRRVLVLAALAASASGCAGSYGLPDGDASYDAIKAASVDCAAKGGVIQLKNQGDGRKLSGYECKIGGTR